MEENKKSSKIQQKGYREVLKNKNFLFLWLAQVFSQLGDRVIFVVFVAIIAHNFGTSSSVQSWLYVAFTIPAILLTAIAGVFADRFCKKKILFITNVIRAILLIALPIFSKTLLLVYLLAFLISTVTQFFVPAEASSIPTLVERDNLLTANSLFTTTMMGSIIFGFVLGDPLINAFGLNMVHYSISIMFILSALCILFIKYKTTPDKPHKHIADFLNDLKQGFIYTKNNSKVLQAMLKLASLFSIIIMLSILAISISQNYLYPNNPALGAQKFAYIIAYSGIGMIIGSFLVGKILRGVKKYLLIYSGFLLIGLSLIALSGVGLLPNEHSTLFKNLSMLKTLNLTYRMLYAYFVSGIIGLASAFIAIPVQTILHTSVPEDIRGKVFGVQFTLLSTASTFPVIIAAFGADKIGVVNMLIAIAIPVIFFGVYNLIKFNTLKGSK